MKNALLGKKVAIFIPVYNAAATLPIVLERIPKELKKLVQEIFVIDNASADNSHLIGIGYKHQKGIHNLNIYRNEKNQGYGGSQKKAYSYCIQRGYDIVVMLHGDAQYAPEEIPKILEPILYDHADMVFGSRMRGNPLAGGMPLYKYIGNRILTKIENLVLGLQLSEFHSGFRAFNCKSLQQVPFELCSNDYYFDTDILIQFKLKNLKIMECAIPTHYGEESHSPSPRQLLSYTMNILFTLFNLILHRNKLRYFKKFDV